MDLSENTQSRTIDGIEFQVTKLDGWKGLFMLRRLSAAIGPALAEVFTALGSKGTALGDIEVSKALPAVGSAISLLLEKCPESELHGITKTLLETAFWKAPNGAWSPLLPAFNIVFTGKVGTALKVIAFSIEVNFGSFLGGITEFVKPHMVAATKTNNQPLGEAFLQT